MEFNNFYLLPTPYLGPIGYYAFFLQHRNCKLEQYEYFVKQSLRTRCDIYGANGKLSLSVPIQRKGSSKNLFKDIQIAYDMPWQKTHWKSIATAYQSTPYFEFYEDFLVPFYIKEEKYLLDLNLNLQNTIAKCLRVSVDNTFTTSYQEIDKIYDLRLHHFLLQKQENYTQVFAEKHGFIPNLSILDVLFHLGPETPSYLERQKI